MTSWTDDEANCLTQVVPYPEQQPLLDFTQAADMLSIGRTSAYTMSRAGTFPVPIVRHGPAAEGPHCRPASASRTRCRRELIERQQLPIDHVTCPT